MGDVKAQRRRCSGRVWDGYARVACKNGASGESAYCKRCDPAIKAAKKAVKQSQLDKDWEERRRTRALAAADTARRDALADLAVDAVDIVATATQSSLSGTGYPGGLRCLVCHQEINNDGDGHRDDCRIRRCLDRYAEIEATHAAAVAAAAGEREGCNGDGTGQD